MSILDEIKEAKLKEVQKLKISLSHRDFEASQYFSREPISLKSKLKDSSKYHIIAEFKRRSPSKGWISENAEPQVIAGIYKPFAAAISVLTDETYFGATSQDILTIRREVDLPILRKDFILDEFQILQSKAMGADIILLIAKMLSPDLVKDLASFAKSHGLEVLLETHNQKEIEENLDAEIDFVGINNRNLNSFEVDLEHSMKLAQLLPKDTFKIAESGISSATDVLTLRKKGFDAFLIGETFMKQENPEEFLPQFFQELNDA